MEGVISVSKDVVLWGVDAQVDFMLPGGKLYAPEAEKIIPAIDRLVEQTRRGRVLLISSEDAHDPDDDPEFRDWPPHCIKGSAGAELIPEAQSLRSLVLANSHKPTLPDNFLEYQQIVLQKNTLNVFDNPDADELLTKLSAHWLHPDAQFVVFGVVTEICVRLTVEALLDRGKRVAIAADAVSAFDPVAGASAIKEMEANGAELIGVEQALSLIGPERDS